MTNKELILDSLIDDEEAFTQILEYFKYSEINISPYEIKILLAEMVEEGYIFINCSWKNEHNEYPYSLTAKGRKAWENIDEN